MEIRLVIPVLCLLSIVNSETGHKCFMTSNIFTAGVTKLSDDFIVKSDDFIIIIIIIIVM